MTLESYIIGDDNRGKVRLPNLLWARTWNAGDEEISYS
jgi:hypothetical protein